MIQEFTQQIEETARNVVNEIHTSLPAKVVAVNNNGTVNVKPYGTYYIDDETELDYPVITEVPLVMSKYITYPIKKNDDVLVVISEVELDAWLSNADSDIPMRYDLNSAICIPHLLKSNDNVKDSIKNNNIKLSLGDTKLEIASNVIKIKGNVEIDGNLTVKGTISATGTVTSGGTVLTGGD